MSHGTCAEPMTDDCKFDATSQMAVEDRDRLASR
jgi:hypothetical protein